MFACVSVCILPLQLFPSILMRFGHFYNFHKTYFGEDIVFAALTLGDRSREHQPVRCHKILLKIFYPKIFSDSTPKCPQWITLPTFAVLGNYVCTIINNAKAILALDPFPSQYLYKANNLAPPMLISISEARHPFVFVSTAAIVAKNKNPVVLLNKYH